ncbi:MAG TPA: tetratricopeptide repeat protein [Burkholderiaceae bacterium]
MSVINVNTAAPSGGNSPQLARLLEHLAQDPGNKLLAFRVIDVSLEENKLDQADSIIDQTAKHWPEDAGLINRRAIAALRRNNPQAAITELEKIVAANLADAPVRYNLAYASYVTGDYAKARAALEPALPEADKVPVIAPLYALCLQQLGEFDVAIAYAEERLRADPDDAELQGVLALLYFDGQKDMDTCRRYTAAALTRQPHHPMALVTASSLAVMDEKPDEALALAERIVQRNPADGRAWSCIGLAYLYKRELKAAEQALQRAVQTMPGHVGTWHLLAWAQLLQNDIDGAEASFNKARDLDRNFGETQGGLAIIAYRRGDKERAKALAERARRLAPANMGQHYLKLLQLQESGDDAAVQRYLEDTLQRKPGFKGDTLLEIARRMMANAPK